MLTGPATSERIRWADVDCVVGASECSSVGVACGCSVCGSDCCAAGGVGGGTAAYVVVCRWLDEPEAYAEGEWFVGG